MSGPTYRPEIDGLRAVAVVPVVLFHADVTGFDGGFVGVDVFFVISGFLITTILAADIAAGRFTLAGFYERRVRRIFPALFVMLGLSTVAALALLLPFELEDYGRSLVASALFVSNIFFRQETGYFVAAAETKPLIHTWSLAIEEQFYIAFPICLWLLWRWARRAVLPVVLVTLAASLALSIAMTHPQNDAAFFYTPARVWELLAGSALALAPRQRPLPRVVAEGLAALGLGLIAFAIFGFDARTPFPGVAAILPVGGAVLVLAATKQNATRAGALLSLGPVRFFGLISYSLYLWHWPLLVFWRIGWIAPPTPVTTAMVVLAAVAAATLSWHFVERPFRTKALLPRRPALLWAGVAALAVASVAGGLVAGSEGLPGRVSPRAQAIADARFDEVGFAACDSLPGGRPCVIGDGPDAAARFVVWGDSHAGMLMPAFTAAARETHVTGLYLGAAGCVPLLGANQYRWGFETCADFADRIVAEIAARPELGTVVLVSRWAFYAESRRFRREVGHPVFISDAETARVSTAENARVFARSLDRTLAALAALGRRVVLVTQAPENEFDLAVAMARADWLGRSVAFAPARADYDARQAGVDALFSAAEARGAAAILPLGEALCGPVDCPVSQDGWPLYRDSNHLTATYAATLAPLFVPTLQGAGDW